MPFSLQAKVLRVLQSGTFHRLGSSKEISVDVRIITATNKDLEGMVREGKFREDLYFRINVVRIHLPSLKERKEDIPLLSECFTRRYSIQIGKEIKGTTDKFQKMLMEYDWPGNVRELENVIRKAIAFTKTPYLTSYDLDLKGRHQAVKPIDNISFKDALRSSVKSLLGSGHGENIYDYGGEGSRDSPASGGARRKRVEPLESGQDSRNQQAYAKAETGGIRDRG